MELFQMQDCTTRCQSRQHAGQLIASITKGSIPQIQAYFKCICKNYSHIVDEFGRTVLHIAASCGKWQLVKWLLEEEQVDFNCKDLESGYTPLHRSLYYGQLSVAQVLLKKGVDVQVCDNEGFTPIDMVMKDKVTYLSANVDSLRSREVYTWGENINYNLGHNIQQGKKYPEVIDFFRKKNCSIKQVLLGKFHSVFLSHSGQVYTCGHGQGGRLGHSDGSASLIPKQVTFGFSCLQIAIGIDHTVLLAENNTVWTFGLNSFYQLGHIPSPEKLITPKLITAKALKNMVIKGICAANYHTVIYTSNKIFTCGLNAGQIGHPKDIKIQISPTEVSALNFKDFSIVHVATSQGAIVCSTVKGDVFILHEYQFNKVASKLSDVLQIDVYGGYLDSSSFNDKLKKASCEPIVLMLTVSGQLYIWHGDSRILRRSLFLMPRQIHCVNVILNKNGMLCITKDGEGFVGQFIVPKYQHSISEKSQVIKEKDYFKSPCDPHLGKLLNKEECVMIKTERISFIHRGVVVNCDSEGRNFAAIQSNPSLNMSNLPETLPSEFTPNLATLLKESDVNDCIHDIVIKLGNKEFAAHKFILACRSEFFNSIFSKAALSGDEISTVTISEIQPEIFYQILLFIYTNTCEILTPGRKFVLSSEKNNKYSNDETFTSVGENGNHKELKQQKHNQKEKTGRNKTNANDDPLKLLRSAAEKLGVRALISTLNSVEIVNGMVVLFKIKNEFPKSDFCRKKMYNLCDTSIRSSDGEEFDCHKCMLTARVEYFHSIFSNQWIETSMCDALSLPVPANILSAILDYLYSDNVDSLISNADLEFLCNTLIISDLLLIKRLLSACENALASMITLKNVITLIEFSIMYNALQLKSTCIEFICLNLASILEMRILDDASEGIMEELTNLYRKMIPGMSWRIITPYFSGPSTDELQYKEERYLEDLKRRQSATNDVNKETKVKCKSTSRRLRFGDDRDKNSSKSEDRGERQRHESFCSVRSDITDHDSDVYLDQVFSQDISEELVDEKVKLQIISTSSSEDIGTSLPPRAIENDSLPWGKQLDMKSSPPLVTDFRRLMELENIEAKQYKSSAMKKISKSSQSCKPVKSPVLSSSPGDSDILKDGKKSPSWKLHEKIVFNFRDLLKKEEEKQHNQENKSRSDKGMSCCKTPVQQSESSSPPVNPWTKLGTSPKSPVCDFTQIVKEEIKSKVIEVKLSNKPLTLIQLEEKAMQELLTHYQALENPEEYITVERLQAITEISSPIWKIRQTVDSTLGYKTLDPWPISKCKKKK